MKVKRFCVEDRLLKLSFQFALAGFLFVPAVAQAQEAFPFRNTKLSDDARIADLVSRMTLDEKIDALSTDTAVPRLEVKSFGSSEGIHGVVQRGGGKANRPVITTTQFPQPPGMGETWDPALVREAGAVEGSEARYISERPEYNRSLLMLWGPQADLARDPRWGRSEEVYGEDPFFNGTMVVSFVRGLQGDDPLHWQSAALLKHFVANSNEDHRTNSNSIFDQRLFWEYYSVPFRMGFVDGGAKGVIASYNAYNGTPMAVNPILKSIVEDKWGVDVLSSDGGAVKLLWDSHKKFSDQKAAVIACLHAGINQFLDTYKEETKLAIREGSISEAEIDALLRRKFVISLRLGLLDPALPAPASSPEPWKSAKNMDVSERMALESVVLLKNDKQTLPLQKSTIKSIAVIGPLADSVHWDWYGGFPPHAVTPLEGIRKAAGPDIKINYAVGELGQAAITAAKDSDVAIVVVGNDPTCGPDMAKDWHDTVDGGGTLACTVPSDGREGRDRESLTLEQEQLVKQVYAVNPKTIVVLVSSFPYTINWSQEHIPAILHMTHASEDEGTAIAKVLFGDYNPGGHLVTTWPRSVDQLPPMMDYNIRDGRTYMYFKDKPLYAFGYGLSYTTFTFDHLHLSKSVLGEGESFDATIDVTNSGSRDGDEVVQLYVAHKGSAIPRAREELKAFRRVHIAAGKTEQVTLTVNAKDLAYWNDKQEGWALEGDHVEVRVGAASDDIRQTAALQVRAAKQLRAAN